jgi:hypothetical protein
MDMTSGYHQIPIAVDSRKYTAFTCFMGVFEWLRLPMGIKPAGSWFQQAMQIIFGALVYRCLEIYLDDLLIHAATLALYLSHLREVFEAARAKRLTFNPKKCKFLQTEFKALGLILTAEGVKMDEEKIKRALDFPVPVQGKHLKSFLGLANYFRDFIPNYATISAPLNALVKDYKHTKLRKLKWTPELIQTYEGMQRAISECQLLYFLNDTDPVHLITDSSDYGFGAYVKS